jgi:AAA domain
VKRLPFFSITGPSGAGKSATWRLLTGLLPECVALDGDALWDPRFWSDTDWFYGAWMRVAAGVQQNGRPVVLCTAAMPDVWQRRPEREWFRNVHMLALVCSEETLRARLTAREPSGPETPSTFVDDTLDFNRWLREHVEHVDTSTMSELDTALRVAEWVRARL